MVRLQLAAAVMALLVSRVSAIAANLTVQAFLNPGLAPTYQLITALRCDAMGNTQSSRAFVVGVKWFKPSSGAADTIIDTNDALNDGPCTPGSPIGSPNASAAAIALADRAALGYAVEGFNVLLLWSGPGARAGVSEQSNFIDFKYTTVAMTSFVDEAFSSSNPPRVDPSITGYWGPPPWNPQQLLADPPRWAWGAAWFNNASPKYVKKQTDFGSTAPTYTGMAPVLAPPTATFGVTLVSPVTDKTIYTCAPNGDCYDPGLNPNPCPGTRIPNIPTAEGCQALCTANPSCKAFHFDLDASGNYGGCWWNQCAVCPFKLKYAQGTYCWKASPVVTTPTAITAMLNYQGALYMAGNFTHLNTSSGFVPASGVAVAGNNLPGTEGFTWQALNSSRIGIAVNNDTVVNAIAALGDVLFFGGSISSLTDGTIVRNLVCYAKNEWFLPSATRYNGNAITIKGRSLDGTDGPITAFATDSSSSPKSLYVGGIFPRLVGPLSLGDVFEPRVNNIALFQLGVNGAPNDWYPLIPSGSFPTNGVTGFITAMVFIQAATSSGAAPSVFVAGEFTDYGGKKANSPTQYLLSWSNNRWSYLSSASTAPFAGGNVQAHLVGPAGKINGLLFKPPNALVVYGKFSQFMIERSRNGGYPETFAYFLFTDYDRPAENYAVWNLDPEASGGQYWALGMPNLLGEVTGAANSGLEGVIFSGTLATPTIVVPASPYESGRTIPAKYGNSADVFLGTPIGTRSGSESNLPSVSICRGDSSNSTISPGPSAPSSFSSGEMVFSMARSPGYMIIIDDGGKAFCRASIDNSQSGGLTTVAPTPGGLTGGAVYASALALTNAAVGGGTRAVLVGGAFNSSGNPQASPWPPTTTSFGLKSLALYAFPWAQKSAPFYQSQYGDYGRWYYLAAQEQTTTTSGALTFPLPSSPTIPNGTVYALTSAASDALDSTFFVGGAFNDVLRAGSITYNEITPVATSATVSMVTCYNLMRVANGTNADSVNYGFCLPRPDTGPGGVVYCGCPATVVTPGKVLLVTSGASPANLSQPQYLSATNYWSALAAPSSGYRVSVRVNQISAQPVDYTTIYGDPSLSPILYGPKSGVGQVGAVYKSVCGGTVAILFSTGFLAPASTYPAGVNFTVTVESTGCVAVNATGYASTAGNFTNIGRLSLANQAAALNLAVVPTPDSTKKLEAPAIVSWAPLFDPSRQCAGLPSTVYAFAQPRLKPAGPAAPPDLKVIFNPYSPYALGQLLVVGGSFTTLCDGTPAGGVAVWEASKSAWSPLFDGSSSGVAGTVYAVAAYGKHLFVGGDFTALDSGAAASGIAVYTSTSPTMLAAPNTSFWAPIPTAAGAVGVVGVVRALYVLPFALDPFKAYTFNEPGSGAHVYAGGSFAALTDGTVVNSVVDIYVGNSNNPMPTMTVTAIRNNPNSTAVGVSGGTVFSITAASSCLFFSGDFTALGDGTATQSIATLAIKVFDRKDSEWRSAFPTSGFFLSALPAYSVPPPSPSSPPSSIYIPTSGSPDPRYPPPTYYTSQGLTGDSAFTGGRVLLGGLFVPLPPNSTLTNEKLLRTYNSLAYLVQSNEAEAGMVVDPVTTWPFYNIPADAVPLA